MLSIADLKIAVIGLGYVGLPLAVEFGKKVPVVGFDIYQKQKRINELKSGQDHTLEVSPEELAQATQLSYSADLEDLKSCNFFIVTVPTPIDEFKQPDLTPLVKASTSIGQVLKKGDVVVYESTVYPGATEETCIPVLEQVSGLKFNQDFFAGYSPERINPGDKLHRVTNILKITSGSTPEVAEFVDQVYNLVIEAGTHKATSIKVAEAAKVIENTQRDVNIALINELAVIFNKMEIDTEAVLQAAGTKWNFLPFRPGLVGGHCIGVDPYYLTHKAQSIGYHPEIILAATTQNDEAKNQIYNVAVGDRTTLNDLFNAIKAALNENSVTYTKEPVYRNFRAGDVRHSQASVEKIKNLLNYDPQFVISQGINKVMPWYIEFLKR